ncbi:MAG: hypothetical protein LBE13_18360 [Bacteroidales bacterium]|jgi:hypothetical protein|nr:hypothetical protein [Bacteroidales bacterium]
MDKKIILMILILAVWTNLMAFGQSPLQTDWQIDKLKGKVKVLKTTLYMPVDIFGIIEKGEVTDWDIREYDKKGNLIKIQMKSKEEEEETEEDLFIKWLGVDTDTDTDTEAEAEKANDTTTYTYTYKYNNEKIMEFDKFKNGIAINKFIYKYDHLGRLTNCLVYDVSDTSLVVKSTFLYGKKCLQMSYLPIGLLYAKTLYNNYNNEYCPVKEYQYNEYGRLISKFLCKYNDKGYPIKSLYYSYYYGIIRKGIYNSKGNVTEINTNKINITCRYTYQYDSKDNWIEQIEMCGDNDVVETIIVREIEYYE